MSTAQSREIMRRYLEEVVGEGDLAVLDEIADEHIVDHAAEANGWPDGRAGIVEHVKYARAAFPDISITIHRLIASEDEVVGWWTGTGTHSGSFLGVEATGRRFSCDAISFFKLRDGKIIDYVVVLPERSTLVRQMNDALAS
jgi:steroid delta-isomerase-like uncharacterized protein